MKLYARSIALVLAAVAVPFAHGQATDEPVRLRLALDHEGRLHLSTEPFQPAPPLPLQPALPFLNDQTEIRVPTATSVGIDLTLRQNDTGSAIPCVAGRGLSQIGAFDGCELNGYNGLPGIVQSGDLVLSFNPGGYYGFDLSYGLGWLDTTHETGLGNLWLNRDFATRSLLDASVLLPGWVGPVLNRADFESERIGLGGFIWLGSELALKLNYEHAQGPMALFQIESGLFPWESGNQDSITLGLNYGRFQGALIGRQLRPDNPQHGGALDSLDLGFSWRMPWWNAAVEFGARNLIVRPRKPDPEAPALEESDLRVPYLRYHQEL